MTAARYGAGQQDAPRGWLGKVKGGGQEGAKGRWFPEGEVGERASHNGNSLPLFPDRVPVEWSQHTWLWYYCGTSLDRGANGW
jgi:hypothetical protein